MNKYHLYSATGYICSSVWAATTTMTSTWIGIAFAVGWLTQGIVCGWIAARKEGER